jgi:hypothetical protein
MDLYAIDGPFTTQQAIQWKALDGKDFKVDTLGTRLKDVKLESDSILELQNFHDILSTAIVGASTNGLLKLPTLQELAPGISIRDIWLPPPKHHRYSIAAACYGNIAACISVVLKRTDFTKSAPKAKFAISSASKTIDGFDLLFRLYRARIPFLGATDFNAYTLIMSLEAQNGQLLINFITSAQDIQAQLYLSTHPSNDNSLLKQFLTQLMKTNVHSFVGNIFGDFNCFIKDTGGNKKYTAHTVESISQNLIDGCAPDVLYLTDKGNFNSNHRDVNGLNPFKDAVVRHRSRSNFSKPKFAVMQLEGSNLTNETANSEDQVEQIKCTGIEGSRSNGGSNL